MFTKLELTYFCRGRCPPMGGKVVRRMYFPDMPGIFWDYAGRPHEDVMLNFKPDLGRYFDSSFKNTLAWQTIHGNLNFSQISFHI